ncbi:MAG: hypothetical protein PVH03_07235 [Chloroflexota bacterium]|jgi:hypothetical protein
MRVPRFNAGWFKAKNLRKVILFALFLCLGVLLLSVEPNRPIRKAVAKGGRLFDVASNLESVTDQSNVRDILETEPTLSDYLTNRDYGYLYAIPITTPQEQNYEYYGCTAEDCVHATLYDYDRGGTIEAMINLDSGQVFDLRFDPQARPGASPYIIPRALAIAASDERVSETIGDVRENEPMMVPMSTWLDDSNCRQDWCVDLTYMAPDGSGQILHIVVNLEEEVVDRLFYTRGRPDREFKQPAAQGSRYNDGCHEQHNWNVCWEMTANDGIEFFDASYDGNLIFSSAKIGQVEVYYPSWPGGYRDEIGYSASVHPYYGTNVSDLGDGFEVQQLYTEFLRWPNCICCYRYEQIIRFFADGSMEFDFISHGPGCDDLSSYRPFWRIDLDIGQTTNDETRFWNGEEWELVDSELDLDLFEPLSPEGYRLYTGSEGGGYLWSPIPTDPIEEDEGRMFVLQYNEGEGEGPIATGPASTFWPPGQWLDDQSLSGENIVVWYIPILQTKHGEPWWCMPDPEPDFSPCNGLLRLIPTTELPVSPTPTPTSEVEPQETPTAEATTTPLPTTTPRPIAGDDAETIILNSGCGVCHRIGDLGETGKVGPDLSNIGAEAGTRSVNLNAEEYLRQSIVEPGAFIYPDCPNGPCQDGIMPGDYDSRLSSEQLAILIDFLLEQVVEPAGETAPAPAITDLPPEDTESTPEITQPEEIPEDSQGSTVIYVLIMAIVIILLLLLLTPIIGSDSQENSIH